MGKKYLAVYATFSAQITTNWVDAGAGAFTQEIAIPDIKQNDTPTIGPVFTGNIDSDRKIIKAWNNVSRVETQDGKIKIYCFEEKTDVVIPIQLMCVQKA